MSNASPTQSPVKRVLITYGSKRGGTAGGQKMTAIDASGNTGAGSIVITTAPVDLMQSTVSAATAVGAGTSMVVTRTARDAQKNAWR